MKQALTVIAIVLALQVGYQVYLSYGANYCSIVDDIPFSFIGFKIGCYLSGLFGN